MKYSPTLYATGPENRLKNLNSLTDFQGEGGVLFFLYSSVAQLVLGVKGRSSPAPPDFRLLVTRVTEHLSVVFF